ncbi:hypothetical protein GTC054_05030 [Burkholderia pseudomallei]|nr:hypothetical protein GTC054_05030 [Burkholderia pseudomallei]
MIGAGRSPATGAAHPARRAVRTTPRAAMHADTPAATRAEIPIETPIDMSAGAASRYPVRRAAYRRARGEQRHHNRRRPCHGRAAAPMSPSERTRRRPDRHDRPEPDP